MGDKVIDIYRENGRYIGKKRIDRYNENELSFKTSMRETDRNMYE